MFEEPKYQLPQILGALVGVSIWVILITTVAYGTYRVLSAPSRRKTAASVAAADAPRPRYQLDNENSNDAWRRESGRS